MEAQVHPKAKFGCVETRGILTSLSTEFCKILNALGVPAWYVDCGSLVHVADGDLNKSARKSLEKQIRSCLGRKCMPVLTTQFTLDVLNGCNIFTEHQLTEICAEIFKPNYLFFFNANGFEPLNTTLIFAY